MEIVKYFISTSFIAATIIFIGKMVFSKLFDGLVEAYKNKLTTELEEFKANQQKILNEYQIKYSRLHEDRADIIVELYKKLVIIESKLEDFVQLYKIIRINPVSEPNVKISDLDIYTKEKYKKSIQNLNKELFDDFSQFVKENDIFFTQDLVTSLIKLNSLLYATEGLVADVSKETLEEGEFKQKLIKYNISSNVFIATLDSIKNIKKELQKEFRILLGVTQ